MPQIKSTSSMPSPHKIKTQFLVSPKQQQFIASARQEIIDILNGKDHRLLLIVGPCSIHDVESAKEYATRLRELAKETQDSFFIVMRTYFEKPRTSIGWKGMIYDPHLDQSHDIVVGIERARTLLIALAEMNVPAATEFLDPLIAEYISDLISWGCIGARTSESQIHRQLASGLPMPIAFKNSTSGNSEIAVNSIVTATHSHTFLGINEEGDLVIKTTNGNPHSHLTLRGGEKQPNYDQESIALALYHLRKANQPQRVIIDCAHDNSLRQHEKQIDVFNSVINQYLDGNQTIRGLALESHLFSGNQQITNSHTGLKYAVSLTDPCLDWQATEDLIHQAHQQIAAKNCAMHPTPS